MQLGSTCCINRIIMSFSFWSKPLSRCMLSPGEGETLGLFGTHTCLHPHEGKSVACSRTMLNGLLEMFIGDGCAERHGNCSNGRDPTKIFGDFDDHIARMPRSMAAYYVCFKFLSWFWESLGAFVPALEFLSASFEVHSPSPKR